MNNNDYKPDNLLQIKLYMIAMICVLIGSLTLGLLGLFNYNIMPGSQSLKNFIYIIIGVCGVYLAINRNTYLPFLGETVYPCNALKDKLPANLQSDKTVSVRVNVPSLSKVVYWAADPESEDMKVAKDPWIAYTLYENSGIATADESGVAILKINKPMEYNVQKMGGFYNRKLDRHVHYRYCSSPGMLSEIKTVSVIG